MSDRDGDASAAGTHVRDAKQTSCVAGKLDRALHKDLGVRIRDEHRGTDDEIEAHELLVPDQVGDRLAFRALCREGPVLAQLSLGKRSVELQVEVEPAESKRVRQQHLGVKAGRLGAVLLEVVSGELEDFENRQSGGGSVQLSRPLGVDQRGDQLVEVELKPEDIEIKTSTSQGPGGQSVNTTYSAIRITHKPTGMQVSIQDEKSQLQNKEKALRVLRARLYEMKLAEQQAKIGAQRRGMIGTGGRSEKIRTYNFKNNRVTDHRINLDLHKLDQVMAGDLDELVAALVNAERAAQLNGPAT